MQARPKLTPIGAACLSAAAGAAFLIACAVEKPESPDAFTQRNHSGNQVREVGPQQLQSPATTYFEFQVEKLAVPRHMPKVEYPLAMQNAGISGQVIAQFVVDETGRVDMLTFKPLMSTRPEFTAAVMDALRGSEFEPAVIGGKNVKQVVQQAFEFVHRVPDMRPLPEKVSSEGSQKTLTVNAVDVSSRR